MPLDPQRTVAELKELRELTGDENGAQRVAWTETWERAREWLRGKLASTSRRGGDRRGRQPVVHAARRLRARGAHRRPHRLGAERRLARRLPQRHRRRRGAAPDRRARASRRSRSASSTGPTRRARASAAGSSARAPRRARWPTRTSFGSSPTATASRCPDALAEHGVDLDTALDARSELESAAAYLELHIEQGPVLESLDLPLGVVLGTFGVERHRITWHGQAAHAGSTPMDERRDALAGAAKLALEIRDIARRTGGGAVCTSGGVVCKPGIVTSVVETAEQLLDQRDLDAQRARRDARRGEGGERAVRRRGVHRGRLGADLVDRADPLRRDAHRLLRGGDPRGRRNTRTDCRRARSTTPPRCRAPASRR